MVKVVEITVFPNFLKGMLHRGIFRAFELRVLTVIDFPKIAGAKGW